MSPSPWSVPDPEAALHDLLSTHAQRRAWEHRHPAAALRATALLSRIPAETYRPAPSTEGRLLAHYLDKSTFGMATPLHQAVTLLRLPETPGTYDHGHDRATQRRHARKALGAGVSWDLPTDPADRQVFVDLAIEKARVDLDNDEELVRAVNLPAMLDTELWITARLEGRPMLAAVAAVDGEWAMIRYFCSFETSRVASSTRYLMTGVLAEELIGRGVRFLCDNKSPLRLPHGVRHFSRMVGFRTGRVKVLRTASRRASSRVLAGEPL